MCGGSGGSLIGRGRRRQTHGAQRHSDEDKDDEGFLLHGMAGTVRLPVATRAGSLTPFLSWWPLSLPVVMVVLSARLAIDWVLRAPDANGWIGVWTAERTETPIVAGVGDASLGYQGCAATEQFCEVKATAARSIPRYGKKS